MKVSPSISGEAMRSTYPCSSPYCPTLRLAPELEIICKVETQWKYILCHVMSYYVM